MYQLMPRLTCFLMLPCSCKPLCRMMDHNCGAKRQGDAAEKLVAVQGHGTWQEYVLVKAEHLASARSLMHELACALHVVPLPVGCLHTRPSLRRCIWRLMRYCISLSEARRFCGLHERLRFPVQPNSLPAQGGLLHSMTWLWLGNMSVFATGRWRSLPAWATTAQRSSWCATWAHAGTPACLSPCACPEVTLQTPDCTAFLASHLVASCLFSASRDSVLPSARRVKCS